VPVLVVAVAVVAVPVQSSVVHPFPQTSRTETTHDLATSYQPTFEPTVLVYVQVTTLTKTVTSTSPTTVTESTTSVSSSTATETTTLPLQLHTATTSTTSRQEARYYYVDGCRIEEYEVVDVETGHSYWEVNIGPCIDDFTRQSGLSGFSSLLVGALIGLILGAGIGAVAVNRIKTTKSNTFRPGGPNNPTPQQRTTVKGSKSNSDN
jgi:hypothetical protein